MYRNQAHMLCILIALLSIGSSDVRAQQPARFAPTHRNVAYHDQHESQKLDVYVAKGDQPMPTMVFIHGGGWRAGSKNNVPTWLKQGVRDGRYSVVSIEYRFTNVATHPAQVNDCMRAIQFIRHRAKDWNIDARRIGVTGGSAGGHLSLWVALHDDIANPEAADPVKKRSSRVAFAISFAGPTDWSLLHELEHAHPAYRQLLGYEPGTAAEAMDAKKKKSVSPISFATQDDPPIMQLHGDRDNIVPLRHASKLDERLRELGVVSRLVVVEGANHGVAGAGPKVTQKSQAFVDKHLLSEGAGKR